MQLKALISPLKTLNTEGPLDREVTGITYDSRRVTPGMVFVAIAGQQSDGHDYIMSAVDRGAAAVICERNGFVSQRVTKVKVADAREALALAAAEYYQHPSRRLKVIGVTGTNGKTTVTFMVRQMLESAGVKTGLLGTIRYEIGERMIPAQRTTPEALEVQQMMAQMVRAGCAACVMEVSSHALDQKRVHGVEFDTAIFTNLTQDHLDYHGTMADYYAAKQKLFRAVELGTKRGTAVINIDDAYGERLAHETQAEVLLSYGLDEAAKVRATNIRLGGDGTRLFIEAPGKGFDCCLPLIGRHNVYNALAAVGAGLALRIEVSALRSALQNLPPVPGRLEGIVAGQPFSVFVDYAHTDDALRNVLTTLREVTAGRLLLTFGCGGTRDTGKRAKMGRVAAELADFTVLTTDNPRRESPDRIVAQIEEGFRGLRAGDYAIELDRRRAIERVIGLARSGDTVLIAGKGHETYQEFEDTVVPFDDRVYARETLANRGYAPTD
ncbi:MAG: UDP-N-acetylmuramoyl-L-alanyl-D-glutamate--2,6-diaminopimelate ligase [Verrucomicrobia bacterium]|nr:UDP-N-acetylmuramoyl-L-alanyl-D-glutamate--2,6-diaminopimelate ligase [Verrucomicrobiota bacterium]